MKNLSTEQQALLSLIQQALWHECPSLPNANWDLTETLANQQGVLWMIYQGAKAYPDRIPAQKIKSWRADMISCVMRNDAVNAVQDQLVSWLNENGIPAAVLKGLSCSRFYPVPETRALGDIDLLIDKENMARIGSYLQKQGYSQTKNEHSFHAGYHSNGIAIELHYAVTQFPDSKGGRIARKISEQFLNNTELCSVNDMSFPVLSDSHQALMLLLHMERHMIEEGVGLRQLCDWATFVYNSSSEHWQNKTLKILDECGLITFAKVLTKVCVKYLGLDPQRALWCMDADSSIAAEMIKEIFRGGNMGAAEEEYMVNLFFDRRQLGNITSNRINGLLKRITQLAYEQYPYTEKAKILLPIYWVYIPVRYWLRSLFGLRKRKKVTKLLEVSEQRQKLYTALKLYRVR